MIDEIYNIRIGAIKICHSSDKWKKTAIEFEKSKEIIFHKLCDLKRETAADEMRFITRKRH